MPAYTGIRPLLGPPSKRTRLNSVSTMPGSISHTRTGCPSSSQAQHLAPTAASACFAAL